MLVDIINLVLKIRKKSGYTAAWLAQLVECQTAVREVSGPGGGGGGGGLDI